MKDSPRLWVTVRAGIIAPMTTLILLISSATALADPVGRVSAFCSYDVYDTASPGFLITPTEGTAHGVGTITCVGVVDGRQLSGGPGRFEWWYSYRSSDVPLGGNTCALAGGSGTWETDLPTVEGAALAMTGSWRAMGNFVGLVHGQLGGLPARMIYESLAEPEHLEGNCVTQPVSQGRVIGEGTLG